MTWSEVLEGEELAYLTEVPGREARVVPLPELHPKLEDALRAAGVTELFAHQAESLAAARRGEHLVVSTGTASGKTLAFNLPVLDELAAEPKLRALYLYPTKALAQDQARSLTELRVPRVKPAIYDGDTEHERRWQIRKWANVILTNPDMLHIGVLPHHDRWGDVLANLRYVVVDEAHVYRGVFGSHVGNVLRRLRRAAQIYGAEPQFLLASATIANPGELARSLLGADATVIEDDAAPRATRTIAFWNPPVLDEALQLRASALGDGSRLLAELVSRGLRTICFAKSRKAAELIHRFAVDRLDAETAARLSPYRAGYTPAQRREIERRLVEGAARRHGHGRPRARDRHRAPRLRHLGRVSRHGGEPPPAVGARRAAKPRAGRARRQRGRARPVLHARARGAARTPGRVGDPRPLQPADPGRPRAGRGLRGADRRSRPGDSRDAALERAEALVEGGELRRTKAGIVWAGRDYPAGRVGLRSASPESITVVDAATGSVLGIVERERAPSTVHEGAIYLHMGESFRVLELDRGTGRGRGAVRERLLHAGEARDDDRDRGGRSGGAAARHGRLLRARQRHRAGRRLPEEVRARPGDARSRGARPPPSTFETEAIWYVPDPEQLEGLEPLPKLLGALHAAEHAMIAILPLWAMCDRWDIGGLSTNLHPQTGRPTVFVYDGHAGGVGIARRGYDELEGWVGDTERLLAGCPCSDGCPSCVQSPKCGNLNEFLDKEAALTLLRRMLAA